MRKEMSSEFWIQQQWWKWMWRHPFHIVSQDIKCKKFLKAHLEAATGKQLTEFNLETTVNWRYRIVSSLEHELIFNGRLQCTSAKVETKIPKHFGTARTEGEHFSAPNQSSQWDPSVPASRNCWQEQNPWISHSIHTTSLGRLWRSSKGVSSVLVSTLRITTSSSAMLLTFYMWANLGKGKGKCKYGELWWWQNNMALQNLKHFKNNQHSWLPVIICFIYSFYDAKKLTFSWQREVLNIMHAEICQTRGSVIIQAKIYFKHLY